MGGVTLAGHTKNGPDLTDAMAYLSASDTLHGVSTRLQIRKPDGPTAAVCFLEAVSVWPDLQEATRQGTLTTQHECKSGDMSDFGAALWTLCWRHDVALGKARWKQTTLPL